jgi:hypothetical protein
MMTAEILARQIGGAKRNHRRRGRCRPLHLWLGQAALQRCIYYLRSVGKRLLPHFRLGNQIAARRSTLPAWIDAEDGFRLG